MSTPRTDAAAKEVRSTENGILVRAEFARKLEHENAALNETTRKLNETTRKHVAAYYEMLAENAALREQIKLVARATLSEGNRENLVRRILSVLKQGAQP